MPAGRAARSHQSPSSLKGMLNSDHESLLWKNMLKKPPKFPSNELPGISDALTTLQPQRQAENGPEMLIKIPIKPSFRKRGSFLPSTMGERGNSIFFSFLLHFQSLSQAKNYFPAGFATNPWKMGMCFGVSRGGVRILVFLFQFHPGGAT